MPNGHRLLKQQSNSLANQFLPQTTDLNKSYAYYRTQFEIGMGEMMGAVKKVSMAMTRLEALHEIALESTPEPKTGKFKNKHQIQKVCPYCTEPKDPRGWHKHIVKCQREQGKRNLLTNGHRN